MANFINAVKKRLRLTVQMCFALLTNAHISGFFTGRLYTGGLKRMCVPGLNCYSCPGALFSCPIGSLQFIIASPEYKLSMFVVGLLFLFGAALGRFVCGWLCPFGLLEDLLYRIPCKIKPGKLPFDKQLRYLRYAVLLIFVLLLPSLVVNFVGQGSPWFCKYICPSGTLLGGIPLMLSVPSLRAVAGGLFVWKLSLLIAIALLSIAVYRPFCRYLCPLGAIYGLFNPVALYSIHIDHHKCTGCGSCTQACKLNINPVKTPNSPDCIRCGECKNACRRGAISMGVCVHSKNK